MTEPETNFLNTEQAAQYLQVSAASLIRWRAEQRGPPYARVGRRVYYKFNQLKTWVAANTVYASHEATSE